MVIKGLKEIQEKTAEAADLASQSQVKYLYVNDGDSAVIRFIDDEEMIQTKLHEYEDIQPAGKKYRKAYCVDNLSGSPCRWCAAGNIPKNVYVFLVYVYGIVHKTQNPELNTNAEATKWEAVKQGTATLYKEEIGEIRVMRIKFGKDGYLKNSILQFVGEYGTLCDRDYKFSRTGSSIKTLYSLIPKDPSKMSTKVLEAKKEAVSLEDILLRKKDTSKKAEAPVEPEVETEEDEAVAEKAETKPVEAKPVKVKKSKEEKLIKEAEDLF